jgi:hypothetical protein
LLGIYVPFAVGALWAVGQEASKTATRLRWVTICMYVLTFVHGDALLNSHAGHRLMLVTGCFAFQVSTWALFSFSSQDETSGHDVRQDNIILTVLVEMTEYVSASRVAYVSR